MTASAPLRQLARATWTHVAFAFLAMGAWAAFANRDHGAGAVLRALLVQGALSGLITLVLKRWLEAAHRRLKGPLGQILPPVASCIAIAALLSLLHRLAGTPEILRTIAVPWSVSTLYAFAYTLSLPKERPA
jgi:hypothetical protein